jgi:hypothetical protein
MPANAGWAGKYTNKFYCCCPCVADSPAPRAILSFFTVQQVIDILFNGSVCAAALRPPPAGAHISQVIIFIVILIMAFSVIGSWIFACLARSELNNMLRVGRQGAQTGKTKIAMLLYYISLIITQVFFITFLIFGLVLYMASKKADSTVGTAVGFIMLVIVIILLPFWVMWAG